MKGVVSVALPKPGATRTFTEECHLEFLATERKIDEGIRSGCWGSSTVIYLDTYPSLRVRQEIIRRYRGVGWNIVQFHEGKRDRPSVTLK